MKILLILTLMLADGLPVRQTDEVASVEECLRMVQIVMMRAAKEMPIGAVVTAACEISK